MAYVYPNTFHGSGITPIADATLSVTSAAVLYGLSVYTVLPVTVAPGGQAVAFRLGDHYRRLVNSARIIGIDTFEPVWSEERFAAAIKDVVLANEVTEDVFVRATVHVSQQVPGTRSRGMSTTMSIFVYTQAYKNLEYGYSGAISFLVLVLMVAVSIVVLRRVILRGEDAR